MSILCTALHQSSVSWSLEYSAPTLSALCSVSHVTAFGAPPLCTTCARTFSFLFQSCTTTSSSTLSLSSSTASTFATTFPPSPNAIPTASPDSSSYSLSDTYIQSASTIVLCGTLFSAITLPRNLLTLPYPFQSHSSTSLTSSDSLEQIRTSVFISSRSSHSPHFLHRHGVLDTHDSSPLSPPLSHSTLLTLFPTQSLPTVTSPSKSSYFVVLLLPLPLNRFLSLLFNTFSTHQYTSLYSSKSFSFFTPNTLVSPFLGISTVNTSLSD
mmetsp:Transcript_4345/g.7627  ORF Transcript_4345/g.7627 Transcript_4345/m.7627 type:complete len:268 (-) Transcript_4345:605-1408(-)